MLRSSESSFIRHSNITIILLCFSEIPLPTSRRKVKEREQNGANVSRPSTAVFKISTRSSSRNLLERPDTASANQSFPTARGLIRK